MSTAIGLFCQDVSTAQVCRAFFSISSWQNAVQIKNESHADLIPFSALEMWVQSIKSGFISECEAISTVRERQKFRGEVNLPQNSKHTHMNYKHLATFGYVNSWVVKNESFATEHSFEIQPSKVAPEQACVQVLCRRCLVTTPWIWRCVLALRKDCLAMDCFVAGFRR